MNVVQQQQQQHRRQCCCCRGSQMSHAMLGVATFVATNRGVSAANQELSGIHVEMPHTCPADHQQHPLQLQFPQTNCNWLGELWQWQWHGNWRSSPLLKCRRVIIPHGLGLGLALEATSWLYLFWFGAKSESESAAVSAAAVAVVVAVDSSGMQMCAVAVGQTTNHVAYTERNIELSRKFMYYWLNFGYRNLLQCSTHLLPFSFISTTLGIHSSSRHMSSHMSVPIPIPIPHPNPSPISIPIP